MPESKRALLDGLLADLGRSGNFSDESYDRIDELIDGDPIALGQRYRIALGLLSDPVRTAVEAGALEQVPHCYVDADRGKAYLSLASTGPSDPRDQPVYRRVEPTGEAK